MSYKLIWLYFQFKQMQYQSASPYVELLESKKKVYGRKYDSKSMKANWRSSPGATSLFSHNKRPYQTESSEKARANRSQNNKKRMTKT